MADTSFSSSASSLSSPNRSGVLKPIVKAIKKPFRRLSSRSRRHSAEGRSGESSPFPTIRHLILNPTTPPHSRRPSSRSNSSTITLAGSIDHKTDIGARERAYSYTSSGKETGSTSKSSSLASSDTGSEDAMAEAAKTDAATPSSAPESIPTFAPLSPQSEGLLISPPLTESQVPDPFLVDDPDDPLSSEEDEAPAISQVKASEREVASAEEIALSPAPAKHAPLPIAAAIPQTPSAPIPSESDDEDEDVPELYLPSLIIPTMFLPIPNTDPLTTLLTKYVSQPEKRPVRDLTGEWQRSDFHTLVMTNSWRALAKMARDRIVSANPEDLNLVLGLWYLRLASLSRLRLFNQTSAECTNLFSVLNAIEPLSAKAWLFDRILPFELEVMYARLKYWAGDHMAYLDALYALLQNCKRKAKAAQADAAGLAMWRERGARVCLIIASQLIEMKDLPAATKLLEPLVKQDSTTSSPALRSSIARIYLQSGYIKKAAEHFAVVEADPSAEKDMKDMNKALLASANGEWGEASKTLQEILVKDADNFTAVNNLAAALLNQGKLKEGIAVLEGALKASPSSVVVAEPFLFNLSTLYELRSANATHKKRDLLIEVAKWSGDGLKTTSLKLQSN